MKRLLKGSIALNCLLIFSLFLTLFHYGVFSKLVNRGSAQEQSFSASPYYLTKSDVFNNNQSTGNIVFLGDSITEINQWGEAFPGKSIENRGISSDTTSGVLNRIDSVVKSKPQKIFILIGINDLVTNIKNQTTLSNYEKIVSTLKSESPNIVIYVQSVLPINEKKSNNVLKINKKNVDIEALNNELKAMSKNLKVSYINLYPNFVDSNGELNSKYTFDGVHLNGKGYKIWEDILKGYLD